VSERTGWIRFSGSLAGPRFDAAELLVADDKIAELVELTAEYTLSTGGELIHFPQRADVDGILTHYVRARPSTPLGRQERDQLIGARLIRRFGLEPHIVVHLADGVVLWTAGVRATQSAASWAARNEVCPVVCDVRGVVGTHAENDLDEVTCNACRVQAEATTLAAWLVQGCGVESLLVKGEWKYQPVAPIRSALPEEVSR
jgi:hypothetical protein